MAKKMLYTQVGKGRMNCDMQEAFQEVQRHVDSRKTPATVTLKLTVYPPNVKDPNFGELDYSINITKPATKSRKYPTLIENGEIIASGSDQTDALQLEVLTEPANAQ